MPLCNDAMERLAQDFIFEIGRIHDGDGRPNRNVLVLRPRNARTMKFAITGEGRLYMETERGRYRLRWTSAGGNGTQPTLQARPSLGDHLFNSYETEIRVGDVVKLAGAAVDTQGQVQDGTVGYVQRCRSRHYDVEVSTPGDNEEIMLRNLSFRPEDVELIRPAGSWQAGDVIYQEDRNRFLVIGSVDEPDVWCYEFRESADAIRTRSLIMNDEGRDADFPSPEPHPLAGLSAPYNRLAIPAESTAFDNMGAP